MSRHPTTRIEEMFVKLFIFTLLVSEILTAHLEKNDECKVKNQKGKCTLIRNCPSALDDIKKGIMPVNCGFEGKNPIVCCVSKSQGQKQKLYKEKCKQFANEISSLKVEEEDGGFHTTVVGGTNAFPGDYPHMALLGYGDKKDIQWNCGGTLISKNYILTAAHCLTHPQYGAVKYIRLGDILLSGSSGTGKTFNVIRTIRHPDFKPPIVYNDIALLQMNKEVTFNKHIKPACLSGEHNISKLGNVVATGWGLTEYGGNQANILQTVTLDVFSIEECNRTYKSSKRRIPLGVLEDKQVCAGGRDQEKDTCQGDSGGPLQWKKKPKDLYTVIGVTSLGKGCGVRNVPAIYTKVSSYIPWIEGIVFA